MEKESKKGEVDKTNKEITKVLKPVELNVEKKEKSEEIKEEINIIEKEDKKKESLENEIEEEIQEEGIEEFARFMGYGGNAGIRSIGRANPNLISQGAGSRGENITIRDIDEEKNESPLSYRPSDLGNNSDNNNYESVRSVSGANIQQVSSIDLNPLNRNPNLGIRNLIPTTSDQAEKYIKAGDEYINVNISNHEEENQRRRRRNF